MHNSSALMKHFFAALPGRLFASLLIFVTLGGAVVRSADVVDNWSFLEPGVLPKVRNFGPVGIPISFVGLNAGGVVDANSTPANPFPGTSRALYLEPGPETAPLRIFTRPFPDKTPARGWYEFTFRIVEGSFNFNPELFTNAWDPKGEWTKTNTDGIFGFNLTPGQPIVFGRPQQYLKTEDLKVLATEENYTFRVEWEPAGDALEFHFLLNGKPLTTQKGEAFSFPVPQSKIADAVLGFRQASGSANSQCFRAFIGSIQAEALEP